MIKELSEEILSVKFSTMVLILFPQETLSISKVQETMGCIIQNCKMSIRSELPHCKEERKTKCCDK
jgi:hypothetical protein